MQYWQGHRAMRYRKAAGVEYPNLYASEESAAKDPKRKQFNCAQRAHQNTLEAFPTLLVVMCYLGTSPVSS